MIGKNNPFNVRYSRLNKWKGLTGQTRGFCDFESLEFGIRAAAYLIIRTYRKRGLKTYAELISAFAPPEENDTKYYTGFVTPISQFPFDCPRTRSDFGFMLYMMAKIEGNPVSVLDILFVLDKYFLDDLK